MKRFKEAQENFIEIQGLIEPAGFDLDGSLLAVEIKVGHGEKYLVDDTPQGQALLKRIGHGVKASGLLRTEDGTAILKILNVQPLDH